MRRYSRSETPVTSFALAERAASLSNATLIEPRVSWRGGNEIDSSYGRWNEVTKDSEIDPTEVYVLPAYCSGSDYSGGLVEVANYKTLLEMMPEGYEDGAEFITYTGGDGTFALAIRVDALTEEILESLESLDDYPLLDEGLHSELEMEAQNEARESWARSDFKTELGRHMRACFESSTRADQRTDESDEAYETRLDASEEYLSEECGEISDSDLCEIFYKMADRANVNWENEQGSDMAIDVERVVSRGLETPREDADQWKRDSYREVCTLIRDSMSETKYDLGIVKWIDPNQLTLELAIAS
jgi:hypothetical protein